MDWSPPPLPEPTVQQGVHGPEHIAAARTKPEIMDEIFWDTPEASPFVALSSKARKTRVVENQQYQWLRMEEMPRSALLNADSLAGDLTLNVAPADASRFVAMMELQNVRTGEIVHATTVVPATGVITVTRSINGINVDMTAGDELEVVSTMHEDGSGPPAMISAEATLETNYVQVHRRAYGRTFRNKSTAAYGGSDYELTKKQVAIELRKDVEMSWFYGASYAAQGIVTAGRWTTGSRGLVDFIDTHVWNLNNTRPTKREFIRFLQYAMRYGKGGYLYGSSTKYLFCSSAILTWLMEEYENLVTQVEVMEKTVGFAPNKVHTPHGDVLFVRSPILDKSHQSEAFLVDLAHTRKVTLKGWDFQQREKEETPGDATEEGEWYGDIGIQVDMELPHAYIKGWAL